MNKFIIFLLLVMFISCSLVEDAPDATDYANVWDPSSTEFYIAPKTLITQKPASLIKQHTTTFTWRSTRTGSPKGTDIDTSEYVNIAWSLKFNDGEFTNVSTFRETTFTFLTDTLNIFEIMTHYPNGEIESPSTIYKFRVDEIDGSSLRFHPRKMTDVSVGTSFEMEIYAEEVENLTGAKIVIQYDPDSLSIISVSAPSDSQFIIAGNGGTTLFMPPDFSDSLGIVTLNMAVAGGTPFSVNGTGKLAIISVVPLLPGLSTIKFTDASIFRNFENNDITISRRVEGIIIAE